MIPIMQIAGVVVGFLPRRYAIIEVLLLSLSWPLILLTGNVEIDVSSAILAMLLALANAAVGAAIAYSIKRGFGRILNA